MHALRTLLVVVALSLGAPAIAQTYPTRPIKVLHGFGAGGAPDAALRQVAVRLERALGTAVVVENRPGASGTIAAAAVARADPDGYTLLFGVAANLAVAPALAKPAPYDPVTAFTPIVEVARGPYVWLVREEAPARSMGEFVAWARARPGQLNYASPGEGSVHHLATEMLKQAAGLDIVHVPITTGGIYVPLLGGQVDAMFDSMPAPLPHLAAGKLRALAVTGPKRLAALPDVPTLAEQGLPGIDVNSWWGFVGPAGLPRDIVLRLNAEVRKALAEPELVAVLAKMAIEPSPGSPEAFGTYLAQEAARWKQVAAKAKP
ncbi:MAG: tripartite tricarboxylate transporter substrate binding protein [Caldimonas sp.]